MKSKSPPSKKPSGYQAGRIPPPPLTSVQQRNLANGSDVDLCNAEVERVARNIAIAIANPETPEIVRLQIKEYLDLQFARIDPTENPGAILALFPLACQRKDKGPSVYETPYIDALTGNHKAEAIKAAEGYRFEPHIPIPTDSVFKLINMLLRGEFEGDDYEMAKALIALIDGIAYVTKPRERYDLAEEIFHRAYAYVVRHSDEETEFIDKALDEYQKAGEP
jgi:hypothetical protein